MRNTDGLLEVYRRLHERFGVRDWWPGETPYEVVIGAILTQNTNWRNVEKAIGNLMAAGALEPETLLALSEERLKELIRPAGFFNQKAERLRDLTKWWMKVSSSQTRDDHPDLRAELLAIKGVGPETADSILLYALEQPVFVVDAYTRRILSRVGMISPDISYDALQELFHQSLPRQASLFNDFHAQFIAIGKAFCRTQPLCEECPLNGICDYPQKHHHLSL